MKFEIKKYDYKYSSKQVVTAFMKVGNKVFRVKQTFREYDKNENQKPVKPMIERTWDLTTAQMKRMLDATDEIEINHKSTFDGMIDGSRYLNGGYNRLSDEYRERLKEQLSNRGLFNCYYTPQKGAFDLYSCVDVYEIKIKGIEFE